MIPAMPGFLYVIGLLELLAALLVIATASSAMHEIIAALLGGFGVVAIGLAGILAELRKGRP